MDPLGVWTQWFGFNALGTGVMSPLESNMMETLRWTRCDEVLKRRQLLLEGPKLKKTTNFLIENQEFA